MRKAEFQIFDSTGYTMPDSNVPPLLYNVEHLDTNYEQEPLNIERVNENVDCSHIPPMLPLIADF